MQDSKLLDEEGRLAALKRFCVLDSAPEHRFDKITSLVRNVLHVPIAAVSLVDKDRQWFKSIDGLDVTETPRSVSFCDHTIRIRSPLNIEDALIDERFMHNSLVTGAPHIRSYLGAPLKTADGYNVGALCAIDTRPRTFGAAEEALLSSFAALVVDELELRQIAERDHLTGTLTRRALMERLGSLRREEDKRSVLVLLDVDHFKSVNDRFGHPSGDEVLEKVASVCKRSLRRGEAIGRMGGEEFAILLTDVSLAQALSRADAMRLEITQLSFSFCENLVVTASFGLAELGEESPGAALAMADGGLYSAKRGGRNRCALASELTKAA